MTDDSGAVTDTMDYDAWGNLLERSGTTPCDYGLHGEYADPATNLVYLRARWYEPATGRFVSMDAFEGIPEEPMTLNKYFAFGNDAINKQDPSGYLYAVSMMITYEVGGILASYPAILIADERGMILEEIVFRRKHINFERSDKWGHWWVEIGKKPRIEESYGWWPKYPVGSIKGLLLGVEGELNGVTSFRGSSSHDPHENDIGDENFSPKLKRNSRFRNTKEVADEIREFSARYSGKWSWPIGQNCHAFQVEMMKKTGLEKPLGGY